MEDFLPLLRKKNITKHLGTVENKGEKPLFLLEVDAERQVYLSVVDKKLQSQDFDSRLFYGNIFHVLRSVEGIKEEKQVEFSWKADDSRIYVKEYPHLLLQLLRCQNLVNAEGKPVAVSSESAKVRLVLREYKERCYASFVLCTPQGVSNNFCFLSDMFVFVDDTIYPIDSVGDNFSMMFYFITDFSTALLERFLSVFYSYMENVELDYEDYSLVYSDAVVKAVPTVVFEKVDGDNSLYLRAMGALPNCDLDFFQSFDLFYLASVSVEHQVVLKRISYGDMGNMVDDLYKLIISYAPTKVLKRAVYQDDDLFIVPAEVASPFLLRGLPVLVKTYQLLGMEKLKEYKLKPVFPKLNVNLRSGIDFLEGDVTLTIDEERFTLKDFIMQYKKHKYVLLSDGNRALINEDYINKLERIFRKSKSDKHFKISFFDLPEVEEMLHEPLEGEVFKHHREVYEGFNQLAKQTMKFSKVKAELRPYQKEGVKWINYLYENNLGGCLADDMGLGKTLQTIAMLVRIYPKVKKPSLLVMPRSLLFNWENEFKKFAPQLDIYTYYGADRDMKAAMKAQIIISTYAVVRNDVEDFSKKKFHYVILDESQNIKNVTAQVTQAVFLLQAEHRLALSGTPIENNLTELYSLFRFLNPTMFGSLEDFNTRYTYPVQRDGDKEVMASLRRKIFPFLLRRLKKDVLKELPERIEQTLYVEMEEEQAKYYEERRRYYYEQVNQNIAKEGIQKSQFVMFQALNELRRIASVPESMSDGMIGSPKLELLLESVMEMVENGHKVVIFFNYIAGIELVSDRLNEAGIDFTCMTGSTHDRKGVIDRFQNDSKCMVLLMTLKTGGVGLNLTNADTVFIFEPWWNKAAEEQAINRLHRFGQTSTVLSYSMITRGTIEEKIRLLQEKKSELFKGLIGNDASSTKHLSEDDIHFILG